MKQINKLKLIKEEDDQPHAREGKKKSAFCCQSSHMLSILLAKFTGAKKKLSCKSVTVLERHPNSIFGFMTFHHEK